MEALSAVGVRAVFGVPGGQTFPLYRAANERGFNHVIMRDERGAACAADAYARVTGGVGVCDATVGPGVTNLVSGLAEALASSSPVLAIVGDVASGREHLRTRSVASQAMDQRSLLAPVTKWTVRVERPDAFEATLDHALRVATSGRPGPVAIEIPEDVFRAPSPEHSRRAFYPGMGVAPRFRSAPTPADVRTVAELISVAQRPLILAGGGALSSGAQDLLSDLAERQRIPVVTTVMGKGSLSEHSDVALGVVGTFGRRVAGRALMEADLLLVLGSKLDQQSTFSWKLPRPDQKLVHVDIDGEELGRAGSPAVAIVADVREFVRALLEELAATATSAGSLWTDHLLEPAEASRATDGATDPRLLVEAMNDASAPGDLVVADASLSSGWAARFLRQGAGRGLLAPRGLAGIGWSPGAAIGARVAASPERRVTVLAGDGGFAFALGEIETAVRIGMPLVYVLLNNSALGWVKHYSGADSLTKDFSTFSAVDFAMVARGMGADGVTAHSVQEFGEMYRAALASGQPTLIDIETSVTATPATTFRDVRDLFATG